MGSFRRRRRAALEGDDGLLQRGPPLLAALDALRELDQLLALDLLVSFGREGRDFAGVFFGRRSQLLQSACN